MTLRRRTQMTLLPRGDFFVACQRFAVLSEVGSQAPAECESLLRRLLKPDAPARLWTDTYLAAIAVAAGLRLVTFDKDFARFGSLARLQLATQ